MTQDTELRFTMKHNVKPVVDSGNVTHFKSCSIKLPPKPPGYTCNIKFGSCLESVIAKQAMKMLKPK